MHPRSQTSAAPNLGNVKQSSKAWNSLPQIFQIISCTKSNLSWWRCPKAPVIYHYPSVCMQNALERCHLRTTLWTFTTGDSCSHSSLKSTPKQPFFNRNLWFWCPIKHHFLKQNVICYSLYQVKYLFCESENYCVKLETFFMYIASQVSATYSTAQLYVLIKWELGWKQVDTCKMFTFLTFRGLKPEKWPLFLDFTNSCIPLKSTPFSRKWVRAWMSW